MFARATRAVNSAQRECEGIVSLGGAGNGRSTPLLANWGLRRGLSPATDLPQTAQVFAIQAVFRPRNAILARGSTRVGRLHFRSHANCVIRLSKSPRRNTDEPCKGHPRRRAIRRRRGAGSRRSSAGEARSHTWLYPDPPRQRRGWQLRRQIRPAPFVGARVNGSALRCREAGDRS